MSDGTRANFVKNDEQGVSGGLTLVQKEITKRKLNHQKHTK
jgi:hypothetical protein